MSTNTADEAPNPRWQIIYPNYINSKKTVQEGRRIGVDKALRQRGGRKKGGGAENRPLDVIQSFACFDFEEETAILNEGRPFVEYADFFVE